MAEVGNMLTPAVLDVRKATVDQTMLKPLMHIWRSALVPGRIMAVT